jgi:ABC-type amino acid transport substrate-binding protein
MARLVKGENMTPKRTGVLGNPWLAWVLAGVMAFVIAGMILTEGGTTARPLEPTTVATAEWSPYVDQQLPSGGPVTQAAVAVFAAAGHDARVRFTTWGLAESTVESGAASAGFPFIASAERTEKYLLTDQFLTFKYAVFFSTAGESGTDEDLVERWLGGKNVGRSFRIGIVEGYDLWDDFEAVADETHERITYPNSESAMEALANGEVDLVPESEQVGRKLLLDPRLPVDATGIRSISVSEGLHILVANSTQGKQLVEDLNSAIRELTRSGELASMQGEVNSETYVAPARDSVELTEFQQVKSETALAISLLPGTRGIVHEWPTSGSASNRALVKLSNGPYAGIMLRLDTNSLRLVED